LNHFTPTPQARLEARRESRLTSSLMSMDGACEVTVVPRGATESGCQLSDLKGRELGKDGIV
jgi:hypothetical protein